MIKLNRKKFLQDLILYVVKPLRARKKTHNTGLHHSQSTRNHWNGQMGNEIGRTPFMIERDQRDSYFIEKGPKSRYQLEDNCVIWGMTKKMIVKETLLDYVCDYWLLKKDDANPQC